ncbi:hypothetical protein FRC02_005038, partial [Tulasnella sp. 418]
QIVISYLRASLYAAASKNDIHLNYLNFEEKIVLEHGVDLVGWHIGLDRNPSSLKKKELEVVLESISSNPPTIYYKKLTKAEVSERKRVFKQKMANSDPPADVVQLSTQGPHVTPSVTAPLPLTSSSSVPPSVTPFSPLIPAPVTPLSVVVSIRKTAELLFVLVDFLKCSVPGGGNLSKR